MDITELLKTQISLSEWFERVGHKESEIMRKEDNEKRDRMGIVHEIIGMPYDKPNKFMAADIAESTRTKEFQKFLNEHGEELCALRLIPIKPNLPKLRMRGHSIKNVVNEWFKEQDINHVNYRADFIPHPEAHLWSTIFVVNNNGIFGEIIQDGHQQLTQGFYDKYHPISFAYDFDKWYLSEPNKEVEKELNEIISKIYITKDEERMQLKQKLNAKFANNYLCGYFETVSSEDFGLYFIDYNRILGELYNDFVINTKIIKNKTDDISLIGQTGSSGQITGKVKIVNQKDVHKTKLESDEILVCDMTSPNYLPLMKQGGGIITDRGGILCHAAIVSRELKKPCIVGTKNATKILEDGDIIKINGDKGIVKKV